MCPPAKDSSFPLLWFFSPFSIFISVLTFHLSPLFARDFGPTPYLQEGLQTLAKCPIPCKIPPLKETKDHKGCTQPHSKGVPRPGYQLHSQGCPSARKTSPLFNYFSSFSPSIPIQIPHMHKNSITKTPLPKRT